MPGFLDMLLTQASQGQGGIRPREPQPFEEAPYERDFEAGSWEEDATEVVPGRGDQSSRVRAVAEDSGLPVRPAAAPDVPRAAATPIRNEGVAEPPARVADQPRLPRPAVPVKGVAEARQVDVRSVPAPAAQHVQRAEPAGEAAAQPVGPVPRRAREAPVETVPRLAPAQTAAPPSTRQMPAEAPPTLPEATAALTTPRPPTPVHAMPRRPVVGTRRVPLATPPPAPAAPTIEVHIGRIDVRTEPPAAPTRSPRPAPPLSLDDYLNRPRP